MTTSNIEFGLAASVCAAAADASRLFTLVSSGELFRWDVSQMRPVAGVDSGESPAGGLVLTPSGIVVVWGWSRIVRAFDATSLRLLWEVDVVRDSAPGRGEDIDAYESDLDAMDEEPEASLSEDDDLENEDDEDSYPEVDSVRVLPGGRLLVSHAHGYLDVFDETNGGYVETLDVDTTAEGVMHVWHNSRLHPGLPDWVECYDWRRVVPRNATESQPRSGFVIPTGNLINLEVLTSRLLAVRRRGGAIQLWDYVASTMLGEWPLKATLMVHAHVHGLPETAVLVQDGTRTFRLLDLANDRELWRVPFSTKVDSSVVTVGDYALAPHGASLLRIDLRTGATALIANSGTSSSVEIGSALLFRWNLFDEAEFIDVINATAHPVR